MGQQHAVEPLDPGVDQLLAQVGRGVDEDGRRAVAARRARRARSSGGGGCAGWRDRRRPTPGRPAARRRTSRSRESSGATQCDTRRPAAACDACGSLEQTASVLARVAAASASGSMPVSLGEHARGRDDEGRLVAAAAMGHRREIGRVGLDQQAVERHVARDGAQVLRLLERHDAGKRDRRDRGRARSRPVRATR